MSAAQDVCRAFPAELGSVAAARRFVRDALADLDEEQRYGLTLVVSELATNALLHAATSFEVSIHHDSSVRIGVTDCDPTPPIPRQASPTDTSGRGLHLIEQLCTRWGVEPVDGGKCVWCELDLSAMA